MNSYVGGLSLPPITFLDENRGLSGGLVVRVLYPLNLWLNWYPLSRTEFRKYDGYRKTIKEQKIPLLLGFLCSAVEDGYDKLDSYAKVVETFHSCNSSYNAYQAFSVTT